MFLLSAKVQVSFAVKEVNIYNSEVKEITENRRRDKTLTIRLTDGEKKKIIAKSRKAKMSTTDFIIASADNAVIRTPEDLRPVVSQLKRIGNNINQIAAKVNSGAVYSHGQKSNGYEEYEDYYNNELTM